MQTLDELQELAELAESYSAAYERARAVTPFDADALSVAAIDLASAGIDALYAIAAVAEQSQPQLSAALSKAAIVGAPDSVSAKAEPVCGSGVGSQTQRRLQHRAE